MKSRPRVSAVDVARACFALAIAIRLSGTPLAAQTGLSQANQTQQLVFAGLRSASAKGRFNSVKSDSQGNLFLLLDQGDGVRILKTDGSATTILAQTLLGAAGDVGVALALGPTGNVYVTGTSTSTELTGTPGAAITTRTDTSTESFLAAFDSSLGTLFVTFTGGSRIAAAALAVTPDAVFVTGSLFSATLPVTPSAFEQSFSIGSSQNGFVEKFSPNGATLLYATYLTGANGNTTPVAIAADSSNSAYVIGSTTAPGYPTTAALVPAMLSSPSGFLTKLVPTGEAASFSTFVPGAGLTSIALDATDQALLISGSVALGQFPLETAYAPVVPLPYQSLIKLSLDGSSVQSSLLLAPGTQSFVAPDATGATWLDQSLTAAILPAATLSGLGDSLALRITPQQTIDQAARFGGLPNANPSFASLPTILTSLTVDPAGDPVIAGAIQPTASSSLLATETYDLPLLNALSSVLPSTIRSAEFTAATCTGSLCAGSAAYLAKLDPTHSAPSLALSTDDAPFIVLRNLASAAAEGLELNAVGASLTTNCPTTLAPAAECSILLSGTGPATLTVIAAKAPTQTIPIAAYSAPDATIVVSPKDLDFGIQTSTSPPSLRSFTVTNLGSTTETFSSRVLVSPGTATPFTESSSDCPAAPDPAYKFLIPAATCQINLAFTASPNPNSDGYLQQEWQVGMREILLTGYSQAAALSVSAAEIDFGTRYPNGPRTPRFLHLSNASNSPIPHIPVTLPASSPFNVADGCPSLLPPQSVCTVRLDYLPAIVPAEDSTTLTLDEGLTVLVTGQSIPAPGTPTLSNPALTITPAQLAFTAPIPVTAVSAEVQSLTLINSGSASIPLTFSLTGDFLQHSTCLATLGGGQSCTISLNFAPSQPGERLGLLTISTGAGFSSAYLPLTGNGTSIVPAENGSLPLGVTVVGQPITLFYLVTHPFPSFTATATGPYTVALIANLGFGPGNPTNFASSVTATCPNCFLAIRFDPTAPSSQPGTLTLFSDPAGNPYTLALKGGGLAAEGLILSPAAQTFGTVPLSSSSPAFLFTLTNLNSSGQSITVSPPLLTGDFTVKDAPTGGQTCTGTLAYSASCLLNLAFVPTALGIHTGLLSLPTSAGSTSATLTGFATADPGLALNPTGLIFNNVPGPTSTQQTITLTNTSTTNLQIAAPTLNNTAFTVTSDCTALAPAAVCTITVTFISGQALVSDLLTVPVTSSIGTTTYTVPVTGAYTAPSAGLEITPAQAAFGPTGIGSLGLPRQYTIQNLTTQTLSLELTIPRQFALIDPPCAALAPAASCTFTAQFIPLTSADTTGSMVAYATSSLGPATFQTITYLDGYGLSNLGPLTFSGPIQSSILNFGQVRSGQIGSATVTLANNNITPITIRRITSATPFLSTTTCGHALTTGQSCTVTLNYAPINQVPAGTPFPASTPDIGLLTIESDASSSPDLVNLTGQGGPVASPDPSNNEPIATYTLSQGSFTFPSTPAGETPPSQIATLQNTGTVPFHLHSAFTTPDFAVQTTCATVLPAASCTFTVASTPQRPGTHIAALQIASDSSTALDFISLLSTTAATTPPTLSISPSSLEFGAVLVAASSTLPVQVTNTGAVPIVFTSTTTTGDYAPTGTCPAPGASLPPSQSCTIQVTFTPIQTGLRTGVLFIATDVSATPFTVALDGTGIQSQLTITPSALNFGDLPLGTSSQLTIALTSSGTGTVSPLAFAITGDYNQTNSCPATLSPSAACSAQITFTPTALGSRPGVLTITSSDPSSPVSVPLTGTGTKSGTGPQNGSFTLSVDGASTATVSVTAPNSASYSLAVNATGGYTGSVSLTCIAINPGVYSNCSIQPTTVTLAGSQEGAIVTITTSDNAPVGQNSQELVLIFATTLLLLSRPRRRFRVCLLALLVVTTSCGSGVSKSIHFTPAGTYQYQVAAASTAGRQITQTVTLNLGVKSPF